MEEAVQAYREALKEFTRERVSVVWGATQNSMGNVLHTLGGRETGTKHLEEAIQAYREALKETTRERIPADWAKTQVNLGNALQVLGERESGTKRLEEAVQAYREVLKEFTRERFPMKWANTQSNLGFALRKLGERKRSANLLCMALDADCLAWEIYSAKGLIAASYATNAITTDLSVMRKNLTAEEYQLCVKKHSDILNEEGK